MMHRTLSTALARSCIRVRHLSSSSARTKDPLRKLSLEDIEDQSVDLSSKGWRIAGDHCSISQDFRFKDFVRTY